MRHATVQVFAYREDIAPVLDALAGQRPPDGWTVTLEAAVTPSDPPAQCTTLAAAEDHPDATVRETPRGKLAARTAAHDAAVAAGTDAVVAWDADVRPHDDGTLAALLGPLDDPGVVAANSRPYAPPREGPVAWATTAAAVARRVVVPHLHGQAAAVSTAGWTAAGPFDTSIDQTDHRAVWREEERAFYKRLQQAGRVARPPGAIVWESPRRARCTVERAGTFGGLVGQVSPWCRRRGVESFDEASGR